MKTNKSSFSQNNNNATTASIDFLSIALGIANSTIRFHIHIKHLLTRTKSLNMTNLPRSMTKDGVLVEQCDLDQSCNLDQQIFKGIFVRNLRWPLQTHLFMPACRYLIDKLGEENEEERKFYRNFLKRNAASVRKNAMCNPTMSTSSNTSNSCHIVYMDGSPSYPASGADTETMSEDGCENKQLFMNMI